MNVAEMIQFMAIEGVGLDSPTAQERAIFLKWLNVANRQLFRVTNVFNQDRLLQRLVLTTQGGVVQLPTNIFNLIQVANLSDGNVLERTNILDIEKYDPNFTANGTPWQYYVTNTNLLNIYPANNDVSLRISYIVDCPSLTEQTTEPEILYPVEYHEVLVDGALYYLFKSENSFRSANNEASANMRWMQGKAALMSYLKGQLMPKLRVITQDF